MQAAPCSVLQTLVASGNESKLILAFTHFDEVKGYASGEAQVAAGLRRSAVVSAERAEQLMVKNGFSAQRARDFLSSMDGPITARIAEPGEGFLRYTDVAGSRGSFLTTTRFGSSAEAVEGLYLKPYGNTASLVQPVTASGRSIVLEGAIKNGASGVRQTLIIDRNAFEFGIGQGY